MSDKSDEKLASLIAEAESDHVEDYRRALARAQEALEKEKRRTERLEAVVERTVRDVALTLDFPPVEPPPKDRRRKREPEVAVPWISDLQLGKKTPTYDSEVARERIEVYGDKVVELVELHRVARPIRKAHVWLTGDIVEGEDIFPGQEWVIDSSLYQQTVRNGPEILGNFLRRMLGLFDEVVVDGVIGNHGRIGKKGQSHPETNTDRMVYSILRTMLESESRISFNFAEPGNSGDRGWYAVSEIGNYRALLVHGDQFRGSLGIPWYGIRKKVLGWHTMAKQGRLPFPEFQDVAFGHWHQPITWTINGIGVRGIGSTESANDYAAENFAGMSRPSQRLLFVAPDKGSVTAEYPEVWLD